MCVHEYMISHQNSKAPPTTKRSGLNDMKSIRIHRHAFQLHVAFPSFFQERRPKCIMCDAHCSGGDDA